MYIIVITEYWESDPDPAVYVETIGDSGIAALFKTTKDAHAYMRNNFGAHSNAPLPNSNAAGWGEWGCRNYYHVRQLQLVEPAAEPVDLDPYDGVNPADHGTDTP